MRVAVVHCAVAHRERLLSICKALAEGIAVSGQMVDVVDAGTGNSRLTVYDYIVVGTEQTGTLTGRVPRRLAEWLAGAGMISGKRSYAFLLRAPFRSGRTLGRLMSIMESEGMIVRNSGVINSAVEAREIGKRLRIG